MAKKSKQMLLTIGLIFSIFSAALAGEEKEYVDNQVVVKFKSGISLNEIETLIQDYRVTVIEKIPQINTYILGLSYLYTVEEAVSELNAQSIVAECEPNYVSLVQDLPNDNLISRQWNLNSDDSESHLHMKDAWGLESGDPDVIVAIIDMGFDIAHEDLQENIWHNPGEIPDNGIDDDQNGYTDDVIGWDFVHLPSEDGPEDMEDPDNDPAATVSTHGNRVLGVIGATANNEIGIAGVSGKCKMMLIRAGYVDGQGRSVLSVSYVVNGILYAVDNGAQVINISSGGTSFSYSYESALQYADQNGVVVVCSAGNEGTSIAHYPAAYEMAGLISVGASTETDERCSFSSYGEWVDVSAPGIEIVSTLLNNQYGITQGTSFSAPMVAGVAALLFSRYPDWSPSQVKDRIVNTADLCEGLRTANATSGRVNAYKALYDAEIDEAPNSALQENNTANTGSALADSSGGGGGCFIGTSSYGQNSGFSVLLMSSLGLLLIHASAFISVSAKSKF